MLKRTKIVCTVGPSTDGAGILDQMIAAGMNVARFNFSHGSHDDHAGRIALVREAAARAGRHIALMLDTKGPEMRLGRFAGGKAELKAGRRFILTGQNIEGTAEKAAVSYKNLANEVSPGARILLADGLISLTVNEISGEDIITTVQNSGVIGNTKRVAVPGVRISLPPVSGQDIADITFGTGQGMDFIAASFIQHPDDILAIRRLLEAHSSRMGIIAKIENLPGIENIDAILRVADGIMVARGDMGVEIPSEDVPLVQKELIAKCNASGKPVITATQMLESMIANPRPTRAEATDIANAILDGSDAIMLSGETASGLYPVQAVETMNRIALRTESGLDFAALLRRKGLQTRCTTTEAISHAITQIAHELQAAAVIAATETGYTARMLSKYRPHCPVIAVTASEKTARQAELLWGVYALLQENAPTYDSMVESSIKTAAAAGMVSDGDLVVLAAGLPAGTQGTTNAIRVHVVGRVLARGTGIGERTVTAPAIIVSAADAWDGRAVEGHILVIREMNGQIAPLAAKAAAIVAEEDGLSSDAAIAGLHHNIPVIVGAAGATGGIAPGTVITIDPRRGVVYQGEANAR